MEESLSEREAHFTSIRGAVANTTLVADLGMLLPNPPVHLLEKGASWQPHPKVPQTYRPVHIPTVRDTVALLLQAVCIPTAED